MAIAKYLKEIGRGKLGSKDMSQAEANDAMRQVLSGTLDRIELGAFCMAMRIKGESTQEFAGFLDAIHKTSNLVQHDCKLVIVPSYNGSRKLPNLTPLFSLLLANIGKQAGFGVLVHGQQTEATRLPTEDVFLQLRKGQPFDHAKLSIATKPEQLQLQAGEVLYTDLSLINPALAEMLDYRPIMGVRNSGHSLVKLMQPCQQPKQSVLISSYTHPEYAVSMAQCMVHQGISGMLLRGTEGEPVSDPRRQHSRQLYLHGKLHEEVAPMKTHISDIPDLPERDAASTAQYALDVLSGKTAVPGTIAHQVQQIQNLLTQI